MALTLDTDLLRKKLGRARIRKDAPTSNLKDPPPELSKGLQYLIDNLLDPMSNGKPVHSGNLDFEQFTDNDLADLYDFYMDVCYDGTTDWYALKKVYLACLNAAPLAMPVQFL